MRRLVSLLIAGVLCAALAARGRADAYDPPANYYAGATGTGATLRTQLLGIMSAGQIMRTYGDFRFSAAIHDADPNHPGNILLVYNRATVSGAWDAENLPWNREHLWPQARQPGSLTNNSTGSLGDPHVLRPANPTINGNRGDMPFGGSTLSGAHGPVSGGYYYPGDADRGDIARALFYNQTRYASTGITLTSSFPTGLQMGQLSSLVGWHFLDPPDDFERRRNHAIYSQALNPTYYTNNRNAYVDNPEFVWAAYVNNANDSRISVQGAVVNPDGSSAATVDLGRVIKGAPTPAPQAATINKSGFNGTYFSVTTAGDATSSLSGKFNAFATDVEGSRSVSVGLNSSTAVPGLKSGTVTIDNLDVTTGGGGGRGANDANDVITVAMSVLDNAHPSFAADAALNSLVIDFGVHVIGDPAPMLPFPIYNLSTTTDFTAALELDAVAGANDVSVLTTTLTPFGGVAALAEGMSRTFTASMNTSTLGTFSASYFLSFSDEDLPGATGVGGLTLMLSGTVTAPSSPSADFDGSGRVDGADLLAWQRGFGITAGALPADGDANGDHKVDGADFDVWQAQFGGPGSGGAAVPEPTGSASLALGLLMIWPRSARRRRRERSLRCWETASSGATYRDGRLCGL